MLILSLCSFHPRQVKGPFTKKMLRRGAFVDKHFENDQNMSFALMEDDPITKTKVRGGVGRGAFSTAVGSDLSLIHI